MKLVNLPLALTKEQPGSVVEVGKEGSTVWLFVRRIEGAQWKLRARYQLSKNEAREVARELMEAAG